MRGRRGSDGGCWPRRSAPHRLHGIRQADHVGGDLLVIGLDGRLHTLDRQREGLQCAQRVGAGIGDHLEGPACALCLTSVTMIVRGSSVS